MDNPVVILVTVATKEEGESIANQVVNRKLAACVNIIPQLQSIYYWQNKIETGSEVLLLIKTMPDRLTDLIQQIKLLHSYDVPEILALPIIQGNQEYIRWVYDSTRAES